MRWLIPSLRSFSAIYCQEAGLCDLMTEACPSLFLLRIAKPNRGKSWGRFLKPHGKEKGSWAELLFFISPFQGTSHHVSSGQCSCPASLFNTTWVFQSFILFPSDWKKRSNWKQELERKKISELLVSLSLIRYLAVGCSGCLEAV